MADAPRFKALIGTWRLRAGRRYVRRVQGRRLLVIHETSGTWVIEDRCPHRGLRLAGGDFDAGSLWCPGHGFRYDLNSGQRLQPPLGGGRSECLTRFVHEIRNGRLGVLLGPSGPLVADAIVATEPF